TTPYIYAIGGLLDANGKKITTDSETTQKLLMFMPGDEVQVKGNVVKVESLDDYGDLKTWTINQKKSTAGTNVDENVQPQKSAA
ncbi:TPA: Clp protease ClpE, partial [Escherichia coli]